VVLCTHASCGRGTRISLPGRLPPGVVRRVVCDGCGQAYETDRVEEIESPKAAAAGAPAAAAAARPPERRAGRAWRIATIPIAAAAVIGALILIQELRD
jgi:hypothetical protein